MQFVHISEMFHYKHIVTLAMHVYLINPDRNPATNFLSRQNSPYYRSVPGKMAEGSLMIIHFKKNDCKEKYLSSLSNSRGGTSTGDIFTLSMNLERVFTVSVHSLYRMFCRNPSTPHH
mmetsp:Transcript_54042/g.80552  ORF Transcript_54042/g.80552 Transcript_54042/m.80552 type:complete len:118 (-) Transcript_54042:3-356(-)